MKKKSSRSKMVPQKENFEIVAFAKDLEQAREYEALLKGNDIPVKIQEDTENIEGSSSLMLMVPEDCLDEAHVIIESQDAYDDFYEFAIDDEERSFLDDEFFDEFL